MKTSLLTFFLFAGMLTSCGVRQSAENAGNTPDEQVEVAEASGSQVTFESYEVDWTLPLNPPDYAKNVYNTEAPEIVVEEWIGEEPAMDGKFVIVDFWATWCGPCVAAIPHMNELAEKFADEVVCIGLSDESVEKVKKMTKPVIDYYSAIDTQATAKKAIEIRGIPLVIVIDPNGKVCWQGHPSGLTEEKVRELIDFYVAAKN